MVQTAIIPWRNTNNYEEVLLISTRILSAGQKKQWIIPQGNVEPWQTPVEAGENEAWEEAGVKGRIEKSPITFFTYNNQNIQHKVFYYPLEVIEQSSDWPEKNERSRIWLNIIEVDKKIKNEKLRRVFKNFKLFLEKNEREFSDSHI